VSAFGVVLLVVLGLAAFALVLVTIQIVRKTERGDSSSAEVARARRRADVLAFREAELAELRSQGSVVDREFLARLERAGWQAEARPAGVNSLERA